MVEILQRDMVFYLQRLINSRVNITPDALIFLEETQPEEKSFSELVTKLSYSETFQSHLTKEEIAKILEEDKTLDSYFGNKRQLEKCVLAGSPQTPQKNMVENKEILKQSHKTTPSEGIQKETLVKNKSTVQESPKPTTSIIDQLEFELNDSNFIENGKFKRPDGKRNRFKKEDNPPEKRENIQNNPKPNIIQENPKPNIIQENPKPNIIQENPKQNIIQENPKPNIITSNNNPIKSNVPTEQLNRKPNPLPRKVEPSLTMDINNILEITENDGIEIDKIVKEKKDEVKPNGESLSSAEQLKQKLSYLKQGGTSDPNYDPDADDEASAVISAYGDEDENSEEKEILKNLKNVKIKEAIRDEKEKYFESVLHKIRTGYSDFKPLAKEYDEEVEILKDPSGKLYTDGKIEDFHASALDKFTKLKKILLARPEANDAMSIYQITRLSQSGNVKFIGMVRDKRVTNGGVMILTLEDPSATIRVLIRNNQGNEETFAKALYILEDSVLLIDGFLQINKHDSSKVVFANQFEFPDMQNNHHVNFTDLDLSICCISDIHFGSTYHMDTLWERFVDFLHGRLGNEEQRKWAGSVKYITIAGDLVEGIGIYPNQERNLTIQDIYDQYKYTAERFAELPDYIHIVFNPGDHDAVRKALPSPKLEKEYIQPLMDLGRVTCCGSPTLVSLHGIKTLVYHGESMIDINMLPGMTNENIPQTMKIMMENRHLVPSYGKKTQIAPAPEDHLVMETVPDIFHTGHLHKNGYSVYKGVALVNSGCFQKQTDFMASLGIVPDCGKPTLINVKGPTFRPKIIDLEKVID